MPERITDADLRFTRSMVLDCSTVTDNRGRVRVINRFGRDLGVVVSTEDAGRLEQLKADDELLAQDGLRGFRGVAFGILAGAMILAGLGYGVWHHGRWYERTRSDAAVEARSTLSTTVPLP